MQLSCSANAELLNRPITRHLELRCMTTLTESQRNSGVKTRDYHRSISQEKFKLRVVLFIYYHCYFEYLSIKEYNNSILLSLLPFGVYN